MINNVTCCKLCDGEIVFEERSTTGLGGDYALTCQKCHFSQQFTNCVMLGTKKSSYELNQRAVLASRMAGNGLTELKTFCCLMDLPPPVTPRSFTRLQKTALQAASNEAEDSMQRAVKEEIQSINDLLGQTDDQDNARARQLKVKGDGTWQKRGFSSLNGAVSIIGAETEKVVDHEVLTSHCKLCNQWRQKNGAAAGEKWEEWFSVHRLICTKNYSGTAGGMEPTGVLRMFKRSEEKYDVQYTQYIGDGDSKTFSSIEKAQPYGHEVQIRKLECIGHIGKRFGYHMRKLKTDMKGKKLEDGKGLFGKGRLTQKIITSMQTYYTGAIRNNRTSLNGMIRDSWAIWYHMGSTDAHPQHQFCPPGRGSWCKYRRAEALDELQEFQHKSPLPAAVMDVIRPVFVKMTSVTLLKRCLGGHTQNSNECFNSILWKICPKNIFVGIDSLKLGAKIATVLFNDRMSGILRILMRMGMTPGLNAVAVARKKDGDRLMKAAREKEEDSKKKRIIYRRLRLDLHEDYVDQDGLDYEAGAY